MSDGVRVLLIEHLDAIGAAPGDATARVAALRAAGAQVELALLESEDAPDLLHETVERAPRAVHTRHFGARALDSLAKTLRASHADGIVWASASRGGGRAAERVLDSRAAVWWPTGICDDSAARGPLKAGIPLGGPCADSALEAARTPRARLPLWDGPYVLAIASPRGGDVAQIVAAFADAASERDELELVILGDPHPALSQLAEQHQVQPRVHCVGKAPREAETCWLQTAACTVAGHEAALSGGLILRALASGRPLLAADVASDLHRWLQAERLVWDPPGTTLQLRLRHALQASPATVNATGRATALAARHDADMLKARATLLLENITRSARRAA